MSNDVEITRNSYRASEVTSRGDSTLEQTVENYVKTHDATIALPGATVTLGTQNLDEDEFDIKVKLSSDVEGIFNFFYKPPVLIL